MYNRKLYKHEIDNFFYRITNRHFAICIAC